MKIIKTYALTEKTLDKDIDKFISDTRNGKYFYDYKHGMEGLKIIKQYFRLIQKEYDNKNHELAKICYKKLLFLLFEDSYEYNHFGYEDIIGRSKLDFEKIISNYFSCLTKLCSVEELLKEYVEYVNAKKDYDFESADKTIIRNLSKDNLTTFEDMVLTEVKDMRNKDYEIYDLVYFLLEPAKFQNNKEKHRSLIEQFSNLIDDVDEVCGELEYK